MTRRREIEQRLHSLSEISGIMDSMKTLALMETRKLGRFLAAQHRVVEGIEAAAADFGSFYPVARGRPEGITEAFILVGSERGFCGDFNEVLVDALDRYQQESGAACIRLIAVGRKLGGKLEDDPRVSVFLDGPSVAEEVEEVLVRLVETVNTLQAQSGPLYLMVLYNTVEGEQRFRPVLPRFQGLMPAAPRYPYAPLLNLSPDAFFGELLDHYLFAALHEMFYASLMAENRRRMRHLEHAVKRLEEQTVTLSTKRHLMRQEEITEEVELIMLSAETLLRGL